MALLRRQEPAGPPPPPGFEAHQKNAASGGVTGMLQPIINDCGNQEQYQELDIPSQGPRIV